ncbi:glucose-1-phosphate cytidylyltransferase [Variovorax sp. dw_954]|uniref:glucose-1-phosphate cytidylyltransferase n=1 Tax=Variovorax sp. dw_954 TaxID=2720078 RepID=UPI001BD626B3|nr:glucose-1-phosphate cytidylyltransferase [Variovorax sp. dw_954]
MKCVILAGGFGTRLAEETSIRPKPMVEIGDRPILWHIMKFYSQFGINDFIVCLGYKGYIIKEYFANYFLHNSDITFDLASNTVKYHTQRAESWRLTLVDTGESSMTGGRLRRVRNYLDLDEPFCMTYGDGLSNVDIRAEIEFHRSHGLMATVASVRPPARFGNLLIDGNRVIEFEEKPQTESGFINGGFFVLQPSVIDLIADDFTIWERSPMEELARRGELASWNHEDFWQPMDTLRDKEFLTKLWVSGNAPWKLWP